MTKKKAPTREQRKRAGWLAAMVNAALQDAEHKAWPMIDAAWRSAIGHDTKGRRVSACLQELRALGRLQRKIDGYDAAMVLPELSAIDPAFSKMKAERARAILANADLSPREKLGGNGAAGPWNALARLAHDCGALGCERVKNPDARTLEATRNRWRAIGAKTSLTPRTR